MKFSKKLLTGVAVAFILLGVALYALGYGLYVRADKLDALSADYEKVVYEADASDVSIITILDKKNNVIVKRTNGDSIAITYYETSRDPYSVKLANGKLEVIGAKSELLFGFIQFSPYGYVPSKSQDAHSIILEIPDSYTGSLNLQLEQGDISAVGLSLNNCEFSTASGDVVLENLDTDGNLYSSSISGSIRITSCDSGGSISADTSSGQVTVAGSTSARRLDIDSLSGRINISDSTAGENVSLSSSSGAIYISDFSTTGGINISSLSSSVTVSSSETGQHLSIDTASGRIELAGITIGTDLSIDSLSGSVSLDSCIIHDTNISTASGSVSGSIIGKREDYKITTDTASGKNNLGNTSSGEYKLEIDTLSGSINIEFIS